MLGRLARYLRFVGEDAAWVRDLQDNQIVRWATDEERFLLTRDRALARRVASSLWIATPDVEEQWRALRRRFPELPTEVRFVRCSLCNGSLAPYSPPADRPLPKGIPRERVGQGLLLFKCAACGHVYWEGSHTADIRERIRKWSREADG